MIKLAPFNPMVPDETRLRFMRLRTDVPRMNGECNICGRTRPAIELDNSYNKGACNHCMIHEFGKGE